MKTMRLARPLARPLAACFALAAQTRQRAGSRAITGAITRAITGAITGALVGCALVGAPSPAHAETAGRPAFRALYKELVEINTTLSSGSCTQAAQAMAARLKSAGFADRDITFIIPPDRPKDANLVAVLKGADANAKAILLLAHIDVVEADPKDWTRDPFKLVEESGVFYARGASDDKAMAAIFVDAMMRFKESSYRPKKSIKLALTCGEETPNTFNGVRYLIANEPALIDAEFALNEGGGGRLANGKRIFNGVQAGEKVYQDFTLETTNPGGHSSRPTKANAIYQLSAALEKVAAYEFPIELLPTTRLYFERMADIESGPIAADMRAILKSPYDPAAMARILADPSRNSILHTTCVATMVNAGHAANALPQRARANVNCRILPGHSQEEVRRQLEAAIADPGVKVTLTDPPESVSPPPKLTKAVMAPIEKLTREMWPGVPVVPIMAAGATDGRFLTPAGIPTYGVSGIFNDPATSNAHGLNESVPVEGLYEGRDFLYALVKAYAGAN